MAEIIQQITNCKAIEPEYDNKGYPKVKTWLLNVQHADGDGWAIVNAPTVNLAQGIFLRQTKLNKPKILQLKELKDFGEEWQICYEGRGYEGISHRHY